MAITLRRLEYSKNNIVVLDKNYTFYMVNRCKIV